MQQTITVHRDTLDIALGSIEFRYNKLAETRNEERSAALGMLRSSYDDLAEAIGKPPMKPKGT